LQKTERDPAAGGPST